MQASFWQDKYPASLPKTVDTAAYHSVQEVFHEAVHRYADKPAFSNMGTTLSYAELDRLSSQMASYFQHHTDLKPGDRIAIQMPNLLQYPVVVFGALRAGLVVVNTNPLYTKREMLHQFTDAGCRAIVILSHYADLLQDVLPQTDIRHILLTDVGDLLPWPRRWLVNSVVRHVRKLVPDFELPEAIGLREALQRGAQRPAVDHVASADDLAVLQYTGGTTGPAKGAMLSHGNLVANLLQMRAAMTTFEPGREIMIAPLPLYHIFAFTVCCLGMIELGGHTVLITNPRDIPAFIKELSRWRYSTLVGLNTLFVGLMNHPEFRKLDFGSLKLTVAGGMAMQQQPSEEWEALTGSRVCEGYGLTEAAPVVTINPVEAIVTGTIGMPVHNTELKVVGEDGQELALGEPGELYVRGPQVMQGYWQQPAATAKAIDADGWLHTGDIAIIQPDGYVRIVDRKKDMILVSGFNVYPNEIEDVAAMHASVLESAAIGVPDAKSGEAIKLFVVKKDPFLTEENLMAHLRANLTGYKVPRYIEFRADLPKTNVGKILRRALREH